MPKTRLTAKLCSTPSQKSPSSEKSPPVKAPEPVKPKQTEKVSHKSPNPSPKTSLPTNASVFDFCLHNDMCESVSESDDDDLPDALSCTEVSSSLPGKGDAVWVKYRSHTFWPCLVLQSNAKTKKIHVVFMDDSPVNGRRNIGEKVYMKFNKNKVLPYNHINQDKFEAEGKCLKSVELRRQFQGGLSKMMDYMTKRALGNTAACKLFLGESSSEEEQEQHDTPVSTPVPPPPVLTPVTPVTRHSPNKRKRVDQDQEDQMSENGTSDKTAHSRKKPMTPDERRAMRKQKNQPLVDFICSLEMKKYLTKIYRGEAACERHRLFTQGTGQHRGLQTYRSGPIDDDDQLERIMECIGDWYQELSQQMMPNMDYLFWVWLPEAIIYALSKVKRCGLKKATEIFNMGIKLTKSEHLEIHKQLTKR